MQLFPTPTLAAASAALARAVAVTVLAVPLVIAMVALAPALVICPFLTATHHRLVTRMLAGRRQWAGIFAAVAPRETSEYDRHRV